MKNIITLTLSLLFCISGLLGQDAAMEAIKSDDRDYLARVMNIEDIDTCIEINGNPYTYLSLAIKLGSTDAFNFLVESGADMDAVCTGKTPLMYAIKYGKFKYVKTLVEAGANVELKNGTKTAMYYAKKYKQADIEEYLETIVSKN